MKNSKDLYGQGLFKEAISLGNSDIYTVGSMTFLGQHKEARWTASQWKTEQLSFDEQVFLNFHLGLSYTRTSHYKKAAEYFKTNLKIQDQQALLPESEFLTYQGIGFFYYFFSKHRLSLKAAYRAHQKLMQLGSSSLSPLFSILCLDLEGHNLIHRMRIHKGIETLETASKIADKYKMTAFAKSLTFSLLLYKSKFVLPPKESIEVLLNTLTKISPEDDYSQAELIFEISNLLMLTGEFKEAQNFLSNHFKVVYKNDNKRQMGQLNFRMTYNLYKQGLFEQALYLAKTARSNLNPLTDRGLMCKILGLEIKIHKTMGEPHQLLLEELKNHDAKIDSLLIQRLNARTLKKDLTINKGEDPTGDVIEKTHLQKSNKNSYEDIVQKQLFSLLADLFEIKPGTEIILLNAPMGHTLIFKKTRVAVLTKPLGSVLQKLLVRISEGPATKEQLIHEVWGYKEYSPLRHDSLIYSSITRLRSLLLLDEQLLHFDGEAYKLKIDVKSLIQNEKRNELKNKNEDKVSTQRFEDVWLKDLNNDLNYRQIATLKNKQFDNISVKDYSHLHDITTMTALRDLKKLCELNYLKKFGQGRATRYLKTTHPL